jgi:hypothetical protein
MRSGSKERSAVPNLKMLLGKIMNSQESAKRLEESAGPHPVRTKDDPITTEDIGLPTGIQPDQVGKLDQLKPDPEKVKDKS